MALMSDVSLPVEHLREQIASTIDLILHLARLADGRRVVSRVAAVEGMEAGGVILRELFTFPHRGATSQVDTGRTDSQAPDSRNGRPSSELVRGLS
jgi:pilus assembly protein CpaF